MSERRKPNQGDDTSRKIADEPLRMGDAEDYRLEAEGLSEEELERAQMGWRGEDEQAASETTTPAGLEDEDEELPDGAEDALQEMAAREMRRDQSYRTGGDDLNPGFDSGIDANAPKQDELPNKKRGGSRGKSDWN